MRSKVTLPWNAAAWRQSTYEPRVRKVHDPIGDHPQMFVGIARFPDCGAHEHACKGCGYHVCSCERQACYTLSGISYTKPEEYNTIVPPNPGPAGPVLAESERLYGSYPNELGHTADGLRIVANAYLRSGVAWVYNGVKYISPSDIHKL